MTTKPTNPKFGVQYRDEDKKLWCWEGPKSGWLEAHRVTWDGNPQDTLAWLEGHGVSRVAVLPGVGSMPALLFQHSVGSTRLELAFPGDLLVDEKSIYGVRVKGYLESPEDSATRNLEQKDTDWIRQFEMVVGDGELFLRHALKNCGWRWRVRTGNLGDIRQAAWDHCGECGEKL